MKDQSPKNSWLWKWLKLILKITVTAVCLWYVAQKIDFAKAWNAVLHARWFFLLLALLTYALSKWVAANRLNIYFRNISINIPVINNVKLFWLGMFYNLFLPG